MNKRCQSFTLIELLTVIMIIVILTGILIPTVQTIKDKAKRVKAQTEVQSFLMAISQYQATFGYLPCAAGGSDTNVTGGDYDALLDYLSGDNGRGMVFMELNSTTDDLQDPWSQDYRVVLDADYDGDVDSSLPAGTSSVNASAAVWSTGDPDDPKNVTSW